MDIRSTVLKGVKWTTVSTIVLAVVAILKISILTRFLDKSAFGLVAIVTFILTFMELFNDMGISTAILHKQEISEKQYSSLYWTNLLFSGSLYVLVYLITPLVAAFYDQPILSDIMPLLGLNLVFTGIGRQFRVIKQKEMNFRTLAIVDIFAALSSLILALILAIQGKGIYSLVYSTVFQFFISNLFFVISGLRTHKVQLYCNFKIISDFLKIGIYQVGGQLANYFNRDLDVLIIGKIFSADILGGYSLAKQLVFRPFQIINPIIIKVASPALAKFQNDGIKLKENYLQLLNIVSSVNIMTYLLLLIFTPIVVMILYGEGYETIYMIVRILCIYMIFRSIGNPIGSLVVATGRTDLDFNWNIITLIVTPLAVFIGSIFGLEGVTYALCISMIFLYYPSWRFLVKKMVDISFLEYVKACFSPKVFFNIIYNLGTKRRVNI